MTPNHGAGHQPHEPGPLPGDDLDALLRAWHRQNAERAAAGRERLVDALANQGRQPQPAKESPSPTAGAPSFAGQRVGDGLDRARAPSSAKQRVGDGLRGWATHRLARVAASILLLLGLAAVVLLPDWPSKRSGTALAMDLREVGFAPPLLVAEVWPDPTDEAAFHQAETAVAEARVQLEEALAIEDDTVLDPWIPWTRLYRNLLALGRWEEALAEALEFLAYAKKRDEQPPRYSMHYVALTDVGNIYLALGDYDTAWVYHEQSLRVARDSQEWAHRTGRGSDPRPHTLEAALVSSVAPRLWMLSRLAAVEGDQDTAWQYHNQAGELLIDYFRKDCAFRGLTPIRAATVRERTTGATRPSSATDANAASATEGDGVTPRDASLYDLCLAVAAAVQEDPATEDRSFESPAVLVRQHLLHAAALLRLDQGALPPADRNLTDTAEALAQAQTIPYFVRADDHRQDFHIPMEALRIAIARGDFTAALSAADEAAQNTGPRCRPGFPDQPPIRVLARAELRFLRGTALAALDPTNPEALNLIESAIDAVHELAAPLPEARRRPFTDCFRNWILVARDLRAGDPTAPQKHEQPLGNVSLARFAIDVPSQSVCRQLSADFS